MIMFAVNEAKDTTGARGRDELIEGAMEGILRRNGQTLPGTAEVTPREPQRELIVRDE